jgi:hypothetical protein
MLRSHSARKTWLLAGAAAAAMHGMSSPARAADESNKYAAFVSALSALSASASDAIQNERNAARLELIRQEVTKKVLAAYPMSAPPGAAPDSKTISLGDVLDETSLLCGLRYKAQVVVAKISPRDPNASITIDHLNTLAQQNYLSGAASKLQAVAASSNSTDIFAAFKALFADYQISLQLQPNASNENREASRKSCEADLKEFDAAYFGVQIPTPPAAVAAAEPAAAAPNPLGSLLGLLGPVGTLGNSIIGIIEPIVVDFANLATSFEKQQAIRTFLSTPANQTNLRGAGLGLGRTTSDSLFAKRLSLAGTFAEQIAVLGGTSVDLTSKEIQAACPGPYVANPAMYQRGANGLPTAQFRRCYHAVWAQFEKPVTAALQTAGAYDQLADAGDTSTALNKYNKLTADFNPIIDGNVDSSSLWDTASQLLTFASAIKNAFSADNLKKLQQEFAAVTKGN